MRLYILLFLLFISCQRDLSKEKVWIGNAGITKNAQINCNPKSFKKSAVYCLRDWLTGEDAGGQWQQIGTAPQDITPLLVGDNPCIEWNPLPCGQYQLMYIVGDACCRDTAYVNPLKCGDCGGGTICN